MTPDIDSQRIEVASLRAWPALEEVALESWSLRSSDGFTRRANSVQTAPGSHSPLSARVATCEEWYARRNRPCLFRLTPLSESDLDEFLAERSYERVEPTDVLSIEAPALASRSPSATLRSLQLTHWLQVFARLSDLPEPNPAMGQILAAIPAATFLGVLLDESQTKPVACGLAVVDGGLVGLFDLVVATDARRCGHGARLVNQLVTWGVSRGATHAYLLVSQSNVPASNLYRKLGFEPRYQYWYRVRTT